MKRITITGWLGLITLFLFSLIVARFYFTERPIFLFLIWNIFLAWIPLFLSQGISPSEKKPLNIVLFVAWLAFFPNALYIITDLLHLRSRPPVPLWFDIILLFTAAWLGLMLGMVSLLRIDFFLARKFSPKKRNWLIPGIIGLAAFGVYLGRFLRWNSWDIVQQPGALFNSIFQRVVFPHEHLRTWAITGILAILYYLAYYLIKKLPVLLQEQARVLHNELDQKSSPRAT